ncbi:MAG: hypothetical protein WCS85_04105 [Candidatus Peribacteraceae bacterium]
MKMSAKKSGVRTVRGNERSLRFERLERRELLAASALNAVSQRVPTLDLHGGDQGKVIAAVDFSAAKLSHLDGLVLVPAQGSADMDRNVRSITFRGDLDYNTRNGCETTMGWGVIDPLTGMTDIRVNRSVWLYPGQVLHTQVVAGMEPVLTSGKLGVLVGAVDARDVRLRPIDDGRINISGVKPVMHNLVEQVGLIVSASPLNPTGDIVPQGSVVTMQSLDLMAKNRNMDVTGVSVSHQWKGNVRDVVGVYASLGETRITSVMAFSGSGSVNLVFDRPIHVDAGSGTTLSLNVVFRADVVSGSQHWLTVPSVRVAEGHIYGIPVQSNVFRVGGVESGTVTHSHTAVQDLTVDVGQTEAVIGSFTWSVDSVEDQTFYSAMLTQEGTASLGSMTNYALRRGDNGTLLTNDVQVVGDHLFFTFATPYTVLEDAYIPVVVTATVTNGVGQTVRLGVENAVDIEVVGSLYGYGVNGQLYRSPVQEAGTTSEVTIAPNTLAIVNFLSPPSEVYAPDDTVTLATLQTQVSGGAALVQHQYVVVYGQQASGQPLPAVENMIDEVMLHNSETGSTIVGTHIAGGSSGYAIYDFSDYALSGGQFWQVQVDTTNEIRNGDMLQARISGGSGPCDFGGLLMPTTVYNTVAVSVQTGESVTLMGPGGTLVSNYQSFDIPFMTGRELSSVTTMTVVANQKSVSIETLELRASEAGSLLVTQLTVRAAEGSLANGYNYTLWVDTDNNGMVDTIIASGEAVDGFGNVCFDTITNGGFVVGKEQTAKFVVCTDVAANFTVTTLRSEFQSMEVERTSNGSSVGWSVTMARQPLVKFARNGSLYVTKAETLPSHQVLLGALSDPVLSLTLRATDEASDVTKLAFDVPTSQARSIDRLELYMLGSATPFAYATQNNTGSDYVPAGMDRFTARMQSQQCVVPKNDELHILVRARMKSDYAGGMSGDTFTVSVDADPRMNGAIGYGAVQVRGADSSNTYLGNDGDTVAKGEVFIGTSFAAANVAITGSPNTTVGAKIDSIVNANPDANGTSVSAGAHEFGAFKFTAATNTNATNGLDKVGIDGLIFTVTSTNVAMDVNGFRLYNKANSSVVVSSYSLWSMDGVHQYVGDSTISGSFLVKFDSLLASAVDVLIESGTDATFVLRANVTNPDVVAADTSTLRVSLTNFSDPNANGYGVAPNAGHIRWVDWQDQVALADSVFANWIENGHSEIRGPAYQS